MGIFAARKIINKQLADGVSREEVFQQLMRTDSSQAAKHAYAIATIPKTPIPERCLIANVVLLFALLFCSVLTVVMAFPIDLSKPTIFLLLQVVIPLVFMYFVFHYHGAIYRVSVIWFVVDFLEALAQFRQDSLVDSFRILCLFIILVMSVYLARKLFPHLGLLGPKKDTAGHYQL